jgi:hypothetical protein
MSADEWEPLQQGPHRLPETEIVQRSPQAPFQNALAPVSKTSEDTDMDDLALALAGTSLGFVPRGVRKKQKEKAKAQQGGVVTDNLVEMR